MKRGEGGRLDPLIRAGRFRAILDYLNRREDLRDEDKVVLLRRLRWWYIDCREEQVPPLTDWDIWFLLGGRGSGKTRTGSETIAEGAQEHPKTRWACVGPTFGATRAVMFEGDSGLLSVIPECNMWGGSIEKAYNSSQPRLSLANGSYIYGYSSERPGRLRGPQFHGWWADEPAEWRDAHKLPMEVDSTMSNLILAGRLEFPGLKVRGVVTGTPKPCRLLAGSGENPGLLTGFTDLSVAVTKMSSRDNLGNLSPVYRTLVERLDGTRIGRQEIDAELLTDVDGAAWRQAWIVVDKDGVDKDFRTIAIGVDPAGSTSEGSDETGIVVVGQDLDGMFWVLEDLSGKFTPGEWASTVWDAARRWEADAIIVERNFGADMVKDTLLRHTECPDSLVREVTASRGKVVRVQPVAFLYEPPEGTPPGERIRHAAHFPELTEEMTLFTGQKSKVHDDRVDALVWAVLWISRFGADDGSFDVGELLPGGRW